MTRRQFITLMWSSASALTCADAFAAQKSPMARIGFLELGIPPSECCATPECQSSRPDAYKMPACWYWVDMHGLGWREGENIQTTGRWCYGDRANLSRLAADLVALQPDVLVGDGSDETKALQAADIPIVFISSSDPVGYGLVDSIAQPGKNVTGIAVAPQILWGKRLDLLVEFLGRRPAKVACLIDPRSISAKANLVALMQAAEQLGIKVQPLEVHEASDFARVFAAAAGSEAVFVQWLALTGMHAQEIAELAMRYRLPTIYDVRFYVANGGLMSYGLDYRENWRRAMSYVDRILRGARPKDLPVEQASKFELVINLKTAKALSLTVPPSLLVQANEVIE
jgi:putative ABC transport system substrate-binding protein